MTAMRRGVMPTLRSWHQTRGPDGGACRYQREATAERPMRAPDSTSVGWCMPRYMREVATRSRSTASAHATTCTQRWEARGHQQGERDVHRDRHSRMARGEALVDRQVIEPENRRSIEMNDQGRDPVGRGLDRDSEEEETATRQRRTAPDDHHGVTSTAAPGCRRSRADEARVGPPRSRWAANQMFTASSCRRSPGRGRSRR